jgi:5-methylcytosine-specific restriction endonuclease McrA
MSRLRFLQPPMRTLDARIAQPAPKRVDPHYLTPEHQAWRADVIRRNGGTCQDPACKTPNRRPRLYADHIEELQDGGDPLDPANGQALCGACHTRKTAAARAARMSRPT